MKKRSSVRFAGAQNFAYLRDNIQQVDAANPIQS
jgi:hypothetical protein